MNRKKVKHSEFDGYFKNFHFSLTVLKGLGNFSVQREVIGRYLIVVNGVRWIFGKLGN